MPGAFPASPRKDKNWVAAAGAAETSLKSALPDCTEEQSHKSILFNNIAQERVMPRPHFGPTIRATRLYGANMNPTFLIILLKNE